MNQKKVKLLRKQVRSAYPEAPESLYETISHKGKVIDHPTEIDSQGLPKKLSAKPTQTLLADHCQKKLLKILKGAYNGKVQ